MLHGYNKGICHMAKIKSVSELVATLKFQVFHKYGGGLQQEVEIVLRIYKRDDGVFHSECSHYSHNPMQGAGSLEKSGQSVDEIKSAFEAAITKLQPTESLEKKKK